MRARCLVVVAAIAIGVASRPADGASNVNVTFNIQSHTQIAGCAAGPSIQFGVVLPGTIAAPNADCTVSFGSSNATSMLRAWQTDGAGNAMYRMTDGILDPGWDSTVTGNGQFTITGGTVTDGNSHRPGIALQEATGMFVAAYQRPGFIDVVRFLQNGQLDPGFAGTGRYSNSAINWGTLMGIAVGDDGSLYVIGTENTGGNNPVAVLKLSKDGVIDTTFDGPSGSGNGLVTQPIGPDDMWPAGILALADGDLLVYGTNGALVPDGMMARLTPTGVLDPAFGGGTGFVEMSVGAHTYFEAGLEQPDGKILVAGREWGGDPDFVLARVDANGVPDAAWDGPGTGGGGDGIFWVPGTGSAWDSVNGVVLMPDGDVLAVGGTAQAGNDDVYTMRFTGPTGAFEASWDGPAGTGNGRVRHVVTAGDDWAQDVLLGPTNEIYLAGTTSPGGVGLEPLLMKLRDDGTLDDRFDGPSGTGNGVVRVTATATDDMVNRMAAGPDGDIAFVGTTDLATDLLRLTRFDGLAFNDYDDDDIAPADQNWSEGTGFFGVCLRAFTGTAAAATWSVNATCAADDTGTHWRAVPLLAGASKVGQVGSNALDGSASFRFAVRIPTVQPPGSYQAPITFEVVAPAA